METTRQQKVARQIQKDLSDIFMHMTREITQNKMITITVVRMSPDLSLAKVYLSIFPSDKGEELVENITRNAKAIRYELGLRMGQQLRRIPELAFFLDDSIDYLENIDNLLKN